MSERLRIYALTGDDIVRFTLDGANASDPEPVLSGAGARCLAVDPDDPNRLYAGTFDRGLFASEDAGRTWRNDGRGLADDRVLSVSVSPSHKAQGVSVVYAGTEPSNLYRSEDAAHTWQQLPALRELPSAAALVVSAPAMDTSCAHDRAAPHRPRVDRRGHRARRRDAIGRRRRHLDRPQSAGPQRRASAAHPPPRPRPGLRGRRSGHCPVGRPR